MTEQQMIKSYHDLGNCNVASIRGSVEDGSIEVIYMNGYKHIYRTVEEVKEQKTMFYPSNINKPVLIDLAIALLAPFCE